MKRRKVNIWELLNQFLHIIPIFGMLMGYCLLPFLKPETKFAYVISAYTIVSTSFIFIGELIDWYYETKRYRKLPDDVIKYLKLYPAVVPLYYVALSLIFIPVILFALFNYWTNCPIHWCSLIVSFLSAATVFTYLDDYVREENEDFCDEFFFWGNY